MTKMVAAPAHAIVALESILNLVQSFGQLPEPFAGFPTASLALDRTVSPQLHESLGLGVAANRESALDKFEAPLRTSADTTRNKYKIRRLTRRVNPFGKVQLPPLKRMRLEMENGDLDALDDFHAPVSNFEVGAVDANAITLGSDFSGMESGSNCLQQLRIAHRLIFASDKDRDAKGFILSNHSPEIFYDDVARRDPSKTPGCTIYLAGPPCQAFSLAGERRGLFDGEGRGALVLKSVEYIRNAGPEAFVLENVVGLKSIHGGNLFHGVLRDLAESYSVSWKVVDTSTHGLPHRRRRIYVVGVRRDRLRRPFVFPGPVKCMPLEELLDPVDEDDDADRLPPVSQSGSRAIVEQELRRFHGVHHRSPDRVIDVDCSWRWMRPASQTCPCLLRSRKQGLWILSRGRRMRFWEAARMQGVVPDDLSWPSPGSAFAMIGNAMSAPVLERILARLLYTLGRADSVDDRWETGAAQERLRASATAGLSPKHFRVLRRREWDEEFPDEGSRADGVLTFQKKHLKNRKKRLETKRHMELFCPKTLALARKCMVRVTGA